MRLEVFRKEGLPGASDGFLRQLNAFAQAVADALAPSSALVDVTVRTAAVLADTFPLYVKPPEGVTPAGVSIVRIQNATDADAVAAAAVFLDWDLTSEGLIRVKTIVGLSTSTDYTLTLQVLS